MSYVAVVVGITGIERYLKDQVEVHERRKAQHFRSEAAAHEAARQHFDSLPSVVRRQMTYRVEPAEEAQPCRP